ncbi:MAG: hypothetical protein PHT78_10110 [Desulfitobacteriaceae bacterium]|nr:hypothetical protein [Desulfitobacteriaceae bacterium]
MLKKAISILITLAFIISIVPSNTAQALTTKTPEQVKNYAIYYGQPETEKINQLKKFDLVVINPDNFTTEQVQAIKESGTIVLGYQDTLMVSKDNPQLSGLLSGDYLTVNGKRVETTSGSTVQSFLDPRSTHLWEIIKKKLTHEFIIRG